MDQSTPNPPDRRCIVPHASLERYLLAELIKQDAKVALLEKALKASEEKAQQNWDLLETVSIGEKLMCETCKRYHPCDCDK